MNRRWANKVAGLSALCVVCIGAPSHARERKAQRGLPSSMDAPLTEDDAVGFAEEKQWAFSTDAALSVERRTQVQTSATTSLSIFPAADYFVVKNLSVGGGIGVGYQKTGDYRATSFKVGPRIGYNFELTRLLSLWPKLGLSYAHTRSEGDRSEAMRGDRVFGARNNGIAINMFAPFMLLPAPGFFAGFGPFMDTDLSGRNRSTSWGFRLTMGGFL